MVLETEQDLTPLPNQQSPIINQYTKTALNSMGQRASLAYTEDVRKECDVADIEDQSE